MKTATNWFMIPLSLVVAIGYGCSGSAPPEPQQAPQISITAKRFEFSPAVVRLKVGVPVVLQLRSLDRLHGFSVPALGIRADLPAGELVRVMVTPQAAGEYVFLCDIFCGSGHGEMGGRIIVIE